MIFFGRHLSRPCNQMDGGTPRPTRRRPAATTFSEGDSGEVWKNTQTAPAANSVDSLKPVRAFSAGRGLRPVKFLLAVQDVEEADKGPKDFFAEAATARQRVGADDSEQAGEATEPDSHHDPDQAPASPTSTRRPPSGRPPAARTRPTSILAFGSGSRVFRLLRRFLDLWSPITASSASSPVPTQATAESRKPVPISS